MTEQADAMAAPPPLEPRWDDAGWRLGAELMAAAAAGLTTASPGGALAAALGRPPKTGRVLALAFGEVALEMAEALAEAWGPELGDRLNGLVAMTGDHAVPAGFERLAGGPDAAQAENDAAARRALALAEGLGAEDLMVALLSEGAEQVAAAPVEGVSWEERDGLLAALAAAEAPVEDMEVVTRRISALMAGRLAAAASPAAVRAYVFAEGVEEAADAAWFAGGPTAPDPADLDAPRRIISEHRLRRAQAGALTTPDADEARLGAPLRPEGKRQGQESFHLVETWTPVVAKAPEPPRPDHPVFAAAEIAALGAAAGLSEAVAETLAAQGRRVILVEPGASIEGVAARATRLLGEAEPAVLVVAFSGALASAPELARVLVGRTDAAALAMGPQGGASGWRGVLALGDSVARAEALGLPMNDEAFAALGDAFEAPGAARRDLGILLVAVGGA